MKFFSVLFILTFSFFNGTSFAALTGSFAPIAQGSNVNLTAEGKLDWVHWGLSSDTSLNRKATVNPQINDFFVVYNTNSTYAAAYRYADNLSSYTWSDGTQESAITNTTTGMYVVGPLNMLETNGFQFTVPADTALKTLRVYVGTYAARGHFQATLSDHSISYSDTALSNFRNGPGGVYTINFSANSAGQTLKIRWTVSNKNQIDGNVTLQAATLSTSGANNPPYAKITSPLKNASFAAPANFAINSEAVDFDGSISKVEFQRNGIVVGEAANSPYSLTMNNVPAGVYRLTAHPIDNLSATSSSRPVDIFVHGTGGTLNGSVAFPPDSVDLTAEGNVDWIHWGLTNSTSVNRKALFPKQISTFTKIGTNSVQQLTDSYPAWAWSDGTPTVATNTTTGVFSYGMTNGFQLSIPADTVLKTFKVYVGYYGASANFQAWLSDFSAPAFTDKTLTNAYGTSYAVYSLDFAAASAGQTLNIKYTSDYLFDQDFGNVALNAATLKGSGLVLMFNAQATSGNFSFSFQTEAGQNDIVHYTDSLNPISWQFLTNVIGTGAVETVTDSDRQPERFYRIQKN